MSISETDAVIYVTYVGTPETRFDRAYYVEQHLPLVSEAWHAYGLKSVAAFYPAVSGRGTIAICECRFRDEDAMQAAFAATETAGVMDDVQHFTDAAPIRLRAVAV